MKKFDINAGIKSLLKDNTEKKNFIEKKYS
jgi:hypothetical protein